MLNFAMKLIPGLALGALIASPAMAVSFVGSNAMAGNVVADYSDSGLISFDLDLTIAQPVTLNYAITAADIGAPIRFNNIVRNLSGKGFEHLQFTLNVSSFQTVGTVTRSFGTSTVSLNSGNTVAKINFNQPEYLDVFVGSPLGTPGQVDWLISPSSLQAGDTLSITVAVPEAETYAMMLAGLGLVGLMAARRRKA